MGIIKQGILGAFSGKVGAVVGSSWKGIAVMKSRPASVANPKTAKQVLQRTAMSRAVAFAQPVLGEVLKPLNDRFASRMSGYNLFIQRNIDQFEGAIPSNLENISISPRVNKAQLIDAVAADPNNNKVKVSWTSDAGSGFALDDDIPFVVLRKPVSGETFGWRGVRDRQGGFTIAVAPDGWEEVGGIDVYLAFLRKDGTVVFSTAYSKLLVWVDTLTEDADSTLE